MPLIRTIREHVHTLVETRVDETLTSIWSHRPLKRHPAQVAFCRKNRDKTFLVRWVQSRQSSRILWHHDLALLAALGHEFCADAVHQLFEAARLIIADGGTLTDVHVHGAARF